MTGSDCYTLQELTAQDQTVYAQLSHLYEAEFAPLTGTQPRDDGTYPIATPCPAPQTRGWLLLCKNVPVGFMIVHTSEHVNDVAEFFIAPAFRHAGAGRFLAQTVFTRLGGSWQIRQLLTAERAHAFWLAVLKTMAVAYDECIQNDPEWGHVWAQHFLIN